MHLSLNLALLAAQALVGVQAKYATTGCSTGIDAKTGERPARRDITEMRGDVPTFSLYIQGLQAMMDTPEANLTSYFQVAGIHGRPYYAWDSVARASGAPSTGYCTHSDALFMSWHRPYLALFEGILAQHVQIIAKKYNDATYQTAADKFRIPYWDWAAPPYQMPSWFSETTINITTPSGSQTVSNPLNSYKFGGPYPSNTFPKNGLMGSYGSTIRRPNGSGKPNIAAIQSLLASQAPSQAQQLYTIFTRSTTWNQMATQGSTGASFEGPHGWLHVTVGGNGHMTDIGYAGFDPIFWLHHANVDRLGAMWQAIYPSATMSSVRESGGSWTITPGQTINAQTPLLPFHRADGKTPWTTESARYTKDFGYSYPDVKDWLMSTTDLKSSVTARINALYNVRGSGSSSSTSSKSSIMRGSSYSSKSAREWTIQMSAPNNALAGESYAVMLFLSSKPSDASQWGQKSIGSMFVLAQAMDIAYAKGPLPSKTEVVITSHLEDCGIDTKDVKATKKFLAANLVWGVQKADGTVIANEKFAGLELVVQDDLIKSPKSKSEFAVYFDKTVHADIKPITPLFPALGVSVGTPSAGVSVGVPGAEVSVSTPAAGVSLGIPGVKAAVGLPSVKASVGVPGAGVSVGTPAAGVSVGIPGLKASVGIPSIGVSAGIPGLKASVGTPSAGVSVGIPGLKSSIGIPGIGVSVGTPSVGGHVGTPGGGISVGIPGFGLNFGGSHKGSGGGSHNGSGDDSHNGSEDDNYQDSNGNGKGKGNDKGSSEDDYNNGSGDDGYKKGSKGGY